MMNEIQDHTAVVIKGTPKCSVPQCPKCGAIGVGFRLHERRPRKVRVIVDGLVRVLETLLRRWRCPACARTFTEYPSFAFPHARYARGDMIRLARRHAEAQGATYEDSAREDGARIAYGQTDGVMDERQLAPSTIHRWIALFGSMERTLTQAIDAIRFRRPSSNVHRRFRPALGYRCRSDRRVVLLQQCAYLFTADAEYEELFGGSIFLHFARGLGFR